MPEGPVDKMSRTRQPLAGSIEGFDPQAYARRLAVPDLDPHEAVSQANRDRNERHRDKKTNARVDSVVLPKPVRGAVEPPEVEAKPLIDFEVGSTQQNLSIVTLALKRGFIRLSSLPEGADGLAEKALEIYESAIESGRQALAMQALKLVNEISQANLDVVKFLDKSQRLDDGKPTSITQAHSPEQLERVRRIISSSRGAPPPELAGRTMPPPAEPATDDHAPRPPDPAEA